VCDNGRFVRQDLLDQVVWAEVVRLLEDPTLIQQELDRRLAAARASDPTKQREQSLQRDLTRVGKSIERLLSAYQEELVSLEQLRERMPPLRQREQTVRADLQAIHDQTNDRATLLRLAETLTAFLARLRSAADTLDLMERQRIVRLVVKEVLIGDDTIVIRHSIPVTSAPPPANTPPAPTGPVAGSCSQNYLLRKGSGRTALRRPLRALLDQPVAHHPGFQEPADQLQHSCVADLPCHPCHQHIVIDPIEELLQIDVHHPALSLTDVTLCPATRPKAEA
jgi:site-specific DNA recombinase